MNENDSPTQLQMVWPAYLLDSPPAVSLPPGYILRTFRQGDEARFYQVMELAGWPGWNDEKLQPWRLRILPGGWFMVIHEGSNQIVATCMAICSDVYPDGGELGWLAGDPAHGGKGLGIPVTATVTGRFMDAGFGVFHLYTEDFRLPALKTYLKVGYVPYLYTPEMWQRWQVVCTQLDWPYTPEGWKKQDKDGNTKIPQKMESE